jgi:hypothetical protein
MPIWSQHLLILLAVLACVAYIAWQGVLSLRGHKSKLNGCGSCKTCGTNEPASAKPSRDRVAIIPADMLRRRAK